MSKYFLVKNLFNYERVIPPPINLPKELKTVYLTDSDQNAQKASELGWDVVKKTEEFLNVQGKFERRKCIGYINSFPLKVVPEISDASFVFICDSNITRLWELYENFVQSCNENFALFVTSGYYQGHRDNIRVECQVSCGSNRWRYNFNEIKNSTERYINELVQNKIDINSLSIVSAKYIGWNVNHADYEMMSNILYKEYCENLQGNIILTYMSGMYKDKIFNYYTNDYTNAGLNPHNYEA
jgi:hypothetical protein